MSNSFYTHGSFPSTGSAATSASMRAELDLVTAGFDKLPTLSGNANLYVVINSTGTGLTQTSTLPSATFTDTGFTIQDDVDTTKKFQFQASGITSGATRTYTMPDLDTTVVGTTVTQTLTNKSISGSTNTLSAIANASLTNSSFTIGSTSISLGATSTTLAGLTLSGTTTLSGLTASTALALDASKNVVSVANTGTGNNVLATSPTLVTPALGTPSALVGTNITGTAASLTAGNVTTNANLTGAVTSVGNATSLGSFTSAQLATALTDETGSGANVFATSPTLVTPALGTPTSGTLTNCTFPTLNQNTTGTAAGLSATLTTTSGGTGLTSFTANGVVYASSTSALATGSALTFNGTTLSVNGVNVGRGGNAIASNVAVGPATLSVSSMTGTSNTVVGNGAGSAVTSGAGHVFFGTGAGQAINTGDGNVAIGYLALSTGTSAGYNTSVGYQSGVANTGSSNTFIGRYSGSAMTSGNSNTLIGGYNGNQGGLDIRTSSNYIVLSDGDGNTRLIGDSNGNFGIASAPSAWDTSNKVLEFTHGALAGNAFGVSLNTNAYYNSAGNWIFKNTGYATLYSANSGTHYWFTTATGTANTTTVTSGKTYTIITAGGTNYTSFGAANNNVGTVFTASSSGTGNGGAVSENIAWTTPAASINSYGLGLLGYNASSTLTFNCPGSAQISQNSGNSSLIILNSDGGYYGSYLNYNNGSGGGFGYKSAYTVVSPNNASYQFFSGSDATAARFIVYANGGIANYQANNVNLSDAREKTEVMDGGNYLSKICAIPVKRFRYIDQPAEDQATTLGVIAQDVLAVMPEMVTETNWAKDPLVDDAKMRYSLYETDIKYALMRAIQEQQVLIEGLTARLAAAGL